MFGEISLWAWMGAAIVFGIGGGAGFLISRQIKDKRTLELEEKLASARDELAGYRGDVNQHFLKTSLLLGKLTNNYREVYEHLATGAQKLCNEKPNTPELDLPDAKILPPMDITENDAPAIELAAETMVEVPGTEETEETQQAINQPVEASTENSGQIQGDSAEKAVIEEAIIEKDNEEISAASESDIEQNVESSNIEASKASTSKAAVKENTKEDANRPAPEDIPDSEDNDDDVHLGAESAPSIDTEPHKTHPSIH